MRLRLNLIDRHFPLWERVDEAVLPLLPVHRQFFFGQESFIHRAAEVLAEQIVLPV